MMRQTFSFPLYKRSSVILLIFTSLIGLTLIQDFLGAVHNNYPFYFSESLLFSSYWIIFIPMLLCQYGLSRSLKKISFLYFLLFCMGAVLVHLLLYPAIIWGLSSLFFTHSYTYASTFFYTVSAKIYELILLYGIMGACMFYIFPRLKKQPAVQKTEKIYLSKITLTQGKIYTSIDVKDVVYITAASPYIVFHMPVEEHVYTGTLRAMEHQLDPACFVRVHRSAMVNMHKVGSMVSRLNGDYDLVMENKKEVRLSRNYAAYFKSVYLSGTSAYTG